MAENGVLTNTMQSQVHLDEYAGLDILPMFLQASGLLPAWWSRSRDIELARFWPKVDHVASAFSMFASKTASIPVKIVPKDVSIKAHDKQAEYYNSIILAGSDFGKGWHASLGPKFIIDFITQDNGAFIEVIGDAPMVRDPVTQKLRKDYSKPIQGPVLGFAHLDSQSCQRTSNPEYPVLFEARDGSRYRLHHTRVIFAASMPSSRTRMNGVGLCALSRMINTAQHLLDLATSEQEELGSRPKRRLIVGEQGITAQEIVTAFNMADVQMDNEGYSRYSKSVVIAPRDKKTANNPVKITVQDLSLAMTGDIKQTSITLGMFLIALALNIPPRWLWPATSTGATKADAMFQHVAGMGGGIGHLLMVFKQMLGGDSLATAFGKPIPSHLDVIFDYQDDEQDRQQADIREVRSKVYTANLSSNVWDIRVARLQALDAGDITEQHFDDMELVEGRLPDGQDVLNLFYSSEPMMQDMLALSVGDVLNPGENDAETVLQAVADKELEVRALLQNPPRPKAFDAGKQAWAALQALRRLYEDKQAKEEMELQMQQGLEQNGPQAEESKPVEDEMPEEKKPTEIQPAPTEETKESGWMQKLIKAGASKDDILDIVIDTQTDTYHINIGDWAEGKTRQAIRKVFAGEKFVIDDEAAYSNRKRYTQAKESPYSEIVQRPPDIHIHLPDIPPIELNPSIIFPDPVAPIVNVTIPKQDAPIVHVKAPVVNVPEIRIPEIRIPAQEKQAPPVINFNPQINVPKQDAPVVNISNKLELPPVETETIDIQRDANGFIASATKTRTRKRGKS